MGQKESTMRRPSKFKLRDVTRATMGMRPAGLEIDRVEIGKDRSIVVVPGRPPEAIKNHETPEDLRKLL
jgi:hypothetical protein